MGYVNLQVFFGVHQLHSLVSVVSYWESFCSSYMSTSTRARAGPSITLLMFSLARASASRSPRPHTDWSSRIAAREAEREGEIGEAEKSWAEYEDGGQWERGRTGEEERKEMRRSRGGRLLKNPHVWVAMCIGKKSGADGKEWRDLTLFKVKFYIRCQGFQEGSPWHIK